MSNTLIKRNSPVLEVIHDAVCTGCSCLCDDIDLTIQDNQITAAAHACHLGEDWFLNRPADDRPICTIESRPCKLEAGLERAAQILSQSRHPLIYGLEGATCEAQRAAVAIADRIGGVVDTTTSIRQGPTGASFQGVAEVTCSLGEIANRADLVIYWGTDPEESHPRHLSRYSLLPEGMFVPGGRQDRTAVLVDVRPTKTAAEVDHVYQIRPHSDFEALWVLRALALGIELDAEQVHQETGIELPRWQQLMDRMKAARYGVILFGTGLSMTHGRHLNADALFALVRDMNAWTRFVGRAMGGPGNAAGADNVLTWQTGYPFGVNLSRGYPRFNPGEYTATEMLSRGEPDAALIVASDPLSHLSASAAGRLSKIPLIVIDARETDTSRRATVSFRTSAYGIHDGGTVYRMDNIPLSLRPALSSPRPSALKILTAIDQRLPPRD